MRPLRPLLRVFSVHFWGTLPASFQRKSSAVYAKLYDKTWSRHFIRIYCRFNKLSSAYLSRFRPASGGKEYQSFQDFFIRKLKEKPQPEDEPVWPCEGMLCEHGRIEELPCVRVKGQECSPRTIFGNLGEWIPSEHHFANIFLHNKDYHRIHSPVSGRILEMEHVRGELLLLRPWIYPEKPSLPAFRNERVNLMLEDLEKRPYFLSIVGGPAVGGIHMEKEKGAELEPAEELGTFLLGSTCCIAMPRPVENASLGERVEMGNLV